MKLSELLQAEIDSVTMEMDAKGHTRVIFSDDELIKVNSWLKSEMDKAYDDWTPRWNDSVENLDTYNTVKISIPDGGTSIYPAPIARIPADQRISGVYNQLLRPRPIFSIDAYLDASYNVPGVQPQQGVPTGPVPPAPVTAEQCAHNLEECYDFIVRERVQLPQKLLRGIKGAVCGSPYWWKVVADPEQHTTIAPKVDGAVIDFNDKYEETHMRGDIVKWYLVPYTNCMMPIDCDEPDRAPWFAERQPTDPVDLAKHYAVGDYFLIKNDEEAISIGSNTVDEQNEFIRRIKQDTEKKTPSAPPQVCDTWLTWFYRNVKYVDPQQPTDNEGKKVWRIKKLSLLGCFHRTSGKLLDCFLNPNEHQCRPYELVDEMENGDCTVARLKYHQTMFTYAAQSEIKSAHIANNLLFWHDPYNTEVANFFASHKVVNAGDHIPGIKDKDWGTAAAGEKHFSMLEHLKFFLSMSQLDSRENDFTMGGRPPGRTSPNTVQQVYQHAEETRTMFLARLSNKLSRLLRLDMETRRQYQPLGESIPIFDADRKRTMELPFQFPVGDVLDNFRIALTAADDALSQEHDPQQVAMRKAALMQDGEYVAKIIGAIINLASPLPPSGVALFAKIIRRDQKLMRQFMGQMVTDEENYDLTPELEQLLAERNVALKNQQQMPQMPQQQQQGPKITVSLSGKLTPEQENAAAQQQGIGGQNASAPSPGQSAQPPQAGAGPHGGPPAQPPPVQVHGGVPPAPVSGAGAGPSVPVQ